MSLVLCHLNDQTTPSQAIIAIFTGSNELSLSSLDKELIQRRPIKVIANDALRAGGNHLLSDFQASGAIAIFDEDLLLNPARAKKEVIPTTS